MLLRRCTFASAVFVLGLLALAAACSDEREGGLVPPAPDAGEADTSRPPVDAAPIVDAGHEDVDAALPEERVECKVTPCAIALAARGGAHVCALFSDETVACWGADDKGQLGRGTPDGGDDPDHGARPEKVLGVTGATQISAVGSGTSGTTCARIDDGTVKCWGANVHGQLFPLDGTAMTDDVAHPTPALVEGIASAARIDVTNGFACATKPRSPGRSDGDLECWGWNSVLQLGRGYLPKLHGGIGQVPLGSRSAVVASGNLRNASAVSSDGELLSWGGSTWDKTGNKPVRDALGRESSLSPDGTPTPIAGLSRVTSVSASDQHACAVADGKVYCWGKNPTGAVGNGSRQDVATPYAVSVGSEQPLRDVAVSQQTSCARTVNGHVYCWGESSDGQLGGGTAEPTLYPVLVEDLGGAAFQVVAMDRATCALLRDGSVKCWGSNANGQLGTGTRDDVPHLVPEKVVF